MAQSVPAPGERMKRAFMSYIAALFVRHTLAFLVGLLGLILVIDIVGESTRITAVPGAGAPELLTYALLRAPILTAQLFPFVVLLGALATMVMLAYTSQVAAMQSAGLSIHQLVGPMAAAGLVCACLHFALTECAAVPAAARLGAWQKTGYGATAPQPPEAEVWVDTGTAIVHAAAASHDADGLYLEDVTVFRHSDTGAVTAVATAARAVLAHGEGTLEQVIETDLASNRSRTMPEEPWRAGAVPSSILEAPADPRDLGVRALVRVLAARSEASAAFAAELHHRFTWPLACALMPLFAGLAAFSLARAGSVLPRAALGFLLGFSYFVVDSLLGAMARAGVLPPAFAAWLPPLLFLLAAETILLGFGPRASRSACENAKRHSPKSHQSDSYRAYESP